MHPFHKLLPSKDVDKMSEEELTAICQTIDGRMIDTEQEKAHVGPGPLSLVFGELGSRERNFANGAWEKGGLTCASTLILPKDGLRSEKHPRSSSPKTNPIESPLNRILVNWYLGLVLWNSKRSLIC